MKYYAHSTEITSKKDWQTLKDHSMQVALLVEQFTTLYCEPGCAYNLGLCHDLGKYQATFQEKLEGKNLSVYHAVVGAHHWAESWKINPLYMEGLIYCILGHHSGLPDIGTSQDDGLTLWGRLTEEMKEIEEYSHFSEELTLKNMSQFPIKALTKQSTDMELLLKEYGFWVRMMFSALVDADFLDTEYFYLNSLREEKTADFPSLLMKVQNKLDGFVPDTAVKQARAELRKQISSCIHQECDIHLLTMPTGSGKTLTSMEFALHRAILGKKRRIIYIIPYTSIIEQNGGVFRELFGEEQVLEHHSQFTGEHLSDSMKEKLKKASENWDYPIIITTNVQFFQSIYSYKTSQTRKLHNIVNSILVFDEVHMLPEKFYSPCLEAVQMLTTHYHCEALFLSATMPDFTRWFSEFGWKTANSQNLIPDSSCFFVFSRCRIVALGQLPLESLLEQILTQIEEGTSVLLVVNKKATAKRVFQAISCEKYHLSTDMTQFHRDITLSKVKNSLHTNTPFLLVSTSLIEAGVDLDFHFVYRESMGLDNLLQSAGRCNREGKKSGCVTYDFTFSEKDFSATQDDVLLQQGILRDIWEQFPENVDSQESISTYFNRLFENTRENRELFNTKEMLTATSHHEGQGGFLFRTYGDRFKLIDDHSVSLLILVDDTEEEIQALLKELAYVTYSGRMIRRKLQKFMVNVRNYQFQKLQEQGVVDVIEDIWILTNPNYYSLETGLTFEDTNDYIY